MKKKKKKKLNKAETIIIDNNPERIFMSGILDVSIKRLLPRRPRNRNVVRRV